jgi:NAD(P)-dependent dehydrogenase (short-subunit alcohol dehydrogenase family)
MKLGGKVALITGAGSGIGRATAILFAQEGAWVAVADIVVSAGEETAAKIREMGGKALFVQTDVSKPSDVENMVRMAVETYSRLDILHNNAGLALPARVTETSEEIWARCIDVNLKGVMLGCKYAIPEMLKNGGGVIINTASMLGLVASTRHAAYCAAKGGVVLLTKQMAVDYARDNIRVNCICPSEVDTPMHQQYLIESANPEATLREMLDRIPMNRVAEPVEIARAALFLASEDASYITGIALPVDGGLTAL